MASTETTMPQNTTPQNTTPQNTMPQQKNPAESAAADVRYCGRCGEPAPTPHPHCAARLALEPPRYCPQCRRRLIVQVLPTGYTARCSAHGELLL